MLDWACWGWLMPMKVCFELSDRDLRYFRQMLKQVRARGREIDERELLETARDKIHEIRSYSRATRFLLSRLDRLERLVTMLDDPEWSICGASRLRVVEALTYFAEGDDLIPDRVPGLGFLDDAIIIELIVQDLRHEIEAYEDFMTFRSTRKLRARRGAPAVGIKPRREQLHDRIKRRVRRDRSRRDGTGGGSVL
jgi:uncharacterized membrane protein YkvA (DUF1232 family)